MVNDNQNSGPVEVHAVESDDITDPELGLYRVAEEDLDDETQ